MKHDSAIQIQRQGEEIGRGDRNSQPLQQLDRQRQNQAMQNNNRVFQQRKQEEHHQHLQLEQTIAKNVRQHQRQLNDFQQQYEQLALRHHIESQFIGNNRILQGPQSQDLLQPSEQQNLAMQQQLNQEYIDANNLYCEHVAAYEQQETKRQQQNPEIESQRRVYQQRKQEFWRWRQHRYWQQQQRQYRRDRHQQQCMRHDEIEAKRELGYERQVQNEERQLQLLRDTHGPDSDEQRMICHRRQQQRQRHRQRHQAEHVAYRAEHKENPPQQQ